MALIGGFSFAAGTLFYLQGAWPVVGFFGLDAGLVWLAFRLNYRSAKLYETVRLTDEALEISHVEQGGNNRSFRLEPYWVRVSLEREGRTERLLLTSHGRRFLIGPFLNEEERADFARTLRQALQTRARSLNPLTT